MPLVIPDFLEGSQPADYCVLPQGTSAKSLQNLANGGPNKSNGPAGLAWEVLGCDMTYSELFRALWLSKNY